MNELASMPLIIDSIATSISIASVVIVIFISAVVWVTLVASIVVSLFERFKKKRSKHND
jgi:hypothetical protein